MTDENDTVPGTSEGTGPTPEGKPLPKGSPRFKCCGSSKIADTGHYGKGKHNHAPGTNVARTAIWGASAPRPMKNQYRWDPILKATVKA